MDDSGGVTLPQHFDDLDVGVTLHDPETGAILDVNERIEELYGYSRAELREMAVEDYTAPSTKYTQEAAVERIRAAAGGDSQVLPWQVERANGELLWVRVHLNPTTIDGHDCVFAEIRDITEYRTRERRLRLLSRIVRHNLRNRMTVVNGYADRLKRAIEDERLEEELETIREVATEVGSLSESVRQIEEIAEPDATQRSPTDLGRVARSVVEDATADHPSADLTVHVEDEVRVVADEGIRYALEHAVENAIEHNDRDLSSVAVTVTEDPARRLGEVRIVDDGPHIPDVEIDVLDEAVETSSTYHGTGVGLWVMQWCVDSLGGELSFERRSPRGNIVRLALPLADPFVGERA